MSDEPPPPGAEEPEPPVPGVDPPTAETTEASAAVYPPHPDGYAAQQAAYGSYPNATGYSDYYNYYYPGYTPAPGYGQYGYDYNYTAAPAAADPYSALSVDGAVAPPVAPPVPPAPPVDATTTAVAAAAPPPLPAAPPPPPDKKDTAPVQVIPLPEPVHVSPPPPSDPVSPAPAAALQAEAPAPAAAITTSSAPISGPTKETLTELQQRMQELMEKQKQEATTKPPMPVVRKPGIVVPTLRGAKLAIGAGGGATAAAKQASQTVNEGSDARPAAAQKQTIITTPSSVPSMTSTPAAKGLTISAPATIGGAAAKKTGEFKREASPAASPPRRASRRSPTPDRHSPDTGPGRNRSPPEWKGRSYRRRKDDSPEGPAFGRGRDGDAGTRRRDEPKRSPSYDSRGRSISPPAYRRRRSISPPSGEYRRRHSGSPVANRDTSVSPHGGYRGRGRGGSGYRDDYYDEWREDGYYRGRGRTPYRGRARGYYPRRGRGRFNGYHDRFENYDPDDRYDPERSYSDDRYESEDRYPQDDSGYRGRGRGPYEPRGRGRSSHVGVRNGFDERYEPGYGRGRGRRFDSRADAYPDERASARHPREESYSSPASSDQESDRKSESSSPSPSPSPSPRPRPAPPAKPAPKPAYNFEDEFADIDKIDFPVLGGKASGAADSKPSSSGPAPPAAAVGSALAAASRPAAAAALFAAPSVTASSAEKKTFDKEAGLRAEAAGVKSNGAGSLFPVTEWASASTKSKGTAAGPMSKHSKEEEPGSPIYGTNDRDLSGSGSDMEVSKKHKKKHKKHKKKHKKRKRTDSADEDDLLEDDRDVKASDSKRDKKRKRPPAYFQHDDRDVSPPGAGAPPGQARHACPEMHWALAVLQTVARALLMCSMTNAGSQGGYGNRWPCS